MDDDIFAPPPGYAPRTESPRAGPGAGPAPAAAGDDSDIFAAPPGYRAPAQQSAPAPAREAPAPMPEVRQAGPGRSGWKLGDIGRQLGLAARAVPQGLLQVADVVNDAGVAGWNLLSGQRNPLPSTTREAQLDRFFPKPETAQERMVNTVASGMAGGGGFAAASRAAKPASAAGQAIVEQLAAQPGAQVAGAGAGAWSAETARQEGLPGWAQVVAGFGGGVAGGMGAARLNQRAVNQVNASAVMDATGTKKLPAAAGSKAQTIATDAGVDWSELPKAVQDGLQSQVQRALKEGRPLDPTLAQRWLQFHELGTSPTRAMLTRNPMDWAREDRLSTIQGVGEPLLAQRQAVGDAIRGRLNANAAPGDVRTGRAVSGALDDIRGQLEANTRRAYDAANASPEAMAGVPIEDLRRQLTLRQSRAGTQPQYQSILGELDTLSSANPSITQKNLEELRKTINSLRNPADAPSVAATNEMRGWVDDAIGATSSGPAYREARDQHRIKTATIDEQPIVSKLTDMVSTVDRKTPYDKVYQRLMAAGPQGIKQVRNTLEVGGRGGEWQVVKDRVMEDLSNTLNRGATTADRGVSFIQKIENMRDELPAIFNEGELRQIANMRSVAELAMTAPNGSLRLSNPSGTAGQLVGFGQDLAQSAGAGVGRLTAGVFRSMRDAAERSGQRREVSQLQSPALLGAPTRLGGDSVPFFISPALIGLLGSKNDGNR